MKANGRAAVAYIAGRLITGKIANSVFDYGQSKYISIAGTVSTARVQVFDYEQGSISRVTETGHISLSSITAKVVTSR
jgi:hypothetical protein